MPDKDAKATQAEPKALDTVDDAAAKDAPTEAPALDAERPVAPPSFGTTLSAEPALPYEEYRARKALDAHAEAARLKMDEAPEGGRFLADDGKTVVDANGVPIKDKD